MSIIVEGADLVGKSTFVKLLADTLRDRGHSHATCHLGKLGPDGDRLSEYLGWLGPNQIWDRFHVSELAYRAVDGEPSPMTPLKYEMIDAAISSQGGLIVIITANGDLLKWRYAQRGDSLYSLDHILSVNAAFRTIAISNGLVMNERMYRANHHWYIMLPGTDDGAEGVIAGSVQRIVDEYIERRKELAARNGSGRCGVCDQAQEILDHGPDVSHYEEELEFAWKSARDMATWQEGLSRQKALAEVKRRMERWGRTYDWSSPNGDGRRSTSSSDSHSSSPG